MSIIALNRVTVFGLPEDRQKVLEGLQNLGCMHLIALQPPPKTSGFVSAEPAADARQALRYIMDVKRRRHQVRHESEFDLERVVAQALANQQKRREAQDKKHSLTNRLNELKPWGNFTLPALDDLAGYRLWFYCLPGSEIRQLETLKLPWQAVGSDHRSVYVVVIAKEEPPAEALPVKRAHAGLISPKQLEQQLEEVEIELDEIEAEHGALSRWIFLMTQNLYRVYDHAALEEAKTKTKEEDNILLVQGWMPKRDLKRLEDFAPQEGLAFFAEPPKPQDNPPSLMENPEQLSSGQDLVTFYQTPGYGNFDPSIVVFFSFAVFFAMILCDAGYALVLAGAMAIFWKSMGKGPGGRHFRILAVIGLLFAVLYGIAAGSYFGADPPKGSLLAQLKVLNLNNHDEMMKVSITVGCLHILLANALVAYKTASVSGKAGALGWIVVICGGLFMYLGGGKGNSSSTGTALIVAGFLIILFLSSERKPDSFKSVLLRLFDGLRSLMKVSKLFGDVMSYLRLFALGLASASLALTFNQLAGQVRDAVPTLGVPLALLILLFGHGINLLLGIVSGFVHGLRLNFIEFFSWELSGEGYPFQAFTKNKKEDNS